MPNFPMNVNGHFISICKTVVLCKECNHFSAFLIEISGENRQFCSSVSNRYCIGNALNKQTDKDHLHDAFLFLLRQFASWKYMAIAETC